MDATRLCSRMEKKQCMKLIRLPVNTPIVLDKPPNVSMTGKHIFSDLQADDRVLVRNLSEREGPGKLRSHWEDKVYLIIRRKHPDSPVYEVAPESVDGRRRIIHRNLLLPCRFLPFDTTPDAPKKVTARKPIFNNPIPRQRLTNNGQSDSSDDDDNDDDVDYVRFPRPQGTRDTAEDVTARPEDEVLYHDIAKHRTDIEEREESREQTSDNDEPDQDDNEERVESHEQISEASSTDSCTVADEQQQQIRKSSRNRHPPDRLAYFAPGFSINNVQTAYEMPLMPDPYHLIYVPRNNLCYGWAHFGDQLVPLPYFI